MTDATLGDLTSGQERISDSFGVAAGAAILGVLLTWWLIKAETPQQSEAVSSTYRVLSTPFAQTSQTDRSLAERGDVAFAAGDIVAPPGDNALYYYEEALAADPTDASASRGLAQVVEFLLNEAESAIFHSDFDLARDNAQRVLALDPANEHARDVAERAARIRQVETLLNRAVALYTRGKLTEPAGDNAAELYQRVLELDPGNEAARQGLGSVAQRVIAIAESAMYAGEVDKGRRYLRRAKAIAPRASGIAALERTEKNLRELEQTAQVKEKLLAAAEALQSDRLMPPAEPNAYDLYQEVIAAEPDSAAAQRGLELVRRGLLDRARTLLAAEDMSETLTHLDAAEQAGASATAVAELREEARYRQRLLDAEAGRFESLYVLSELTPVSQQAPRYPRTAPPLAAGSVDLHMTVSESGDVRDVEVLGKPRDYFERAAVQAVRNWRFEPVRDNGRPVPVRVAVRVTFEP